MEVYTSTIRSLKVEVNSNIPLLSFPLMREQWLQDSALKVVSNASEFGSPHHLDSPSLWRETYTIEEPSPLYYKPWGKICENTKYNYTSNVKGI